MTKSSGVAHDLKCWPGPFEAVWSGQKTCEVRRDDRGYAVGDLLVLHEFDPIRNAYLQRDVTVRVTHIVREPFVEPPVCVMSIRKETELGENDVSLVDRQVLREFMALGKEEPVRELPPPLERVSVSIGDLLQLLADHRANGCALRDEHMRYARSIEGELDVLKREVRIVLDRFGDEYEGRFARLREIVGD